MAHKTHVSILGMLLAIAGTGLVLVLFWFLPRMEGLAILVLTPVVFLGFLMVFAGGALLTRGRNARSLAVAAGSLALTLGLWALTRGRADDIVRLVGGFFAALGAYALWTMRSALS